MRAQRRADTERRARRRQAQFRSVTKLDIPLGRCRKKSPFDCGTPGCTCCDKSSPRSPTMQERRAHQDVLQD